MSNATLMNHRGARDIVLNDLALIEAPPPTKTWYPISHFDVYRAVDATLKSAGYEVRKQHFSITPDNHRFFGVMDLTSQILDGISMAVGIRNSTDKKFPIGMTVGSRIFVCDNLSFHGEIVIAKKHTRFGQERYREGIAAAIQSLGHYQQVQAQWITELQSRYLSRQESDSIILRSYEEDLIGARMLPDVLAEWRSPTYDEFKSPTAWSLWNCFTTVLGTKSSRPAEAALTTIKLQRLFTKDVVDGKVLNSTEALAI